MILPSPTGNRALARRYSIFRGKEICALLYSRWRFLAGVNRQHKLRLQYQRLHHAMKAVLFHGLPGYEQNLDLAQALRREGWNVLAMHYRGSWGVSGQFSFLHAAEDADAQVHFLLDLCLGKGRTGGSRPDSTRKYRTIWKDRESRRRRQHMSCSR